MTFFTAVNLHFYEQDTKLRWSKHLMTDVKPANEENTNNNNQQKESKNK